MRLAEKAYDPSRRRFLRGIHEEKNIARPPWSWPEARFTQLCTRCDACIDACPENILVRGSGGYPEIDFVNGGCTTCARCADACDHGALEQSLEPPLTGKLSVTGDCLSKNGIVCRACGDVCDSRAIRFMLKTGGRADIVLDLENCTGCGDCIRPCPVGALRITQGSRSTEVA
jgi:ferredoxin-type protein NapF